MSSTPPPPAASNNLTDFRQILEKELGVMKVIDYIAEESYDLAFQKNVFDMYENQLFNPLLGDNIPSESLDGGRRFLQEEYHLLNIKERSMRVIQSAEAICVENGITSNVSKKIRNVQLILMGSLFAAFFILTYLPATSGSSITTYLMFVFIFAICLVPQWLRTAFMKKWNVFKEKNKTILREKNNDDMENLHTFIQEIIDDVRDRLLANKVPLQLVNFVLFSKQYHNVKLVREQNINGTITCIYELEYPEGVTPFPLPKGGLSLPGNNSLENTTTAPSAASLEEEGQDSFILLRHVFFNDDGELTDFEVSYLPVVHQSKIEKLLSESKFNPVNKPEEIITFFSSNTRIMCDCGDPLTFKDLKYCIWEKGTFEFYLAIAHKCPCGKIPFVLFVSPGIKDIPEEFQEFF